MRPPRRLAAALMILPFLTQATGAANLPMMMGPAARPGLFPLPLALKTPPRTAPRPAAKAQSHFWRDCAVVARFLYERAAARPEPAIVAPAPRRKFFVERLGAAPEPAPSRDRMLIVKDPMIVDIAEAVRAVTIPDGNMAVYRPRVEARWHAAPGLRYRVVYLNSYGLTWGDAAGFHLYVPGDPQIDIPAKMPARFYGQYPVYFHGQTAEFLVEVQNTGAAPLEKLRVETVQELYNPDGEGDPTDVPQIQTIPSLKPGAARTLRVMFFVSNSGHARINLEQTHVKVSTRAGRLVDEAHAGLVDPPNL